MKVKKARKIIKPALRLHIQQISLQNNIIIKNTQQDTHFLTFCEWTPPSTYNPRVRSAVRLITSLSWTASPKQKRGYNQCDNDVERLCNKESVQRPLVVRVEQIGKSRFQADAGKGEHKPQSLNAL